MTEVRRETDSLGVVEVPADKLWGAQTQRSLEHFSIGLDLIPPDVLRSARRLCRIADPRERARLLDHAGQGKPDSGGGADHDRRAGDGQ